MLPIFISVAIVIVCAFSFRCAYLYFDPGVCVEVAKSRLFFDHQRERWKCKLHVKLKAYNYPVWVSLPATKHSLFTNAKQYLSFAYNNWAPNKGIYVGGETFVDPVLVGKDDILVCAIELYFKEASMHDSERVAEYIRLIACLESYHPEIEFEYRHPLTNQVQKLKKNLQFCGLASKLKRDYETIFQETLEVDFPYVYVKESGNSGSQDDISDYS